MFYKNFKLLAVISFLIGLNVLQAQEAIPVTGGDIAGNGGFVSYTVGQIVYTSNSGANGSSEEGVQQPYEIWVYSGIDDTEETQFECSVFPNPVTDILTLKINDQKMEKLSYQLYEMKGKLIDNEEITTSETNISMKNFSAGTFFLKVIYDSKELKNFKIIKH